MSRLQLVQFAVMATFSWALWVLFSDLAMRSISVEFTGFLYFVSGALVTAMYLLTSGGEIDIEPTGVAFALIAGAFAASGVLLYYTSVSYGSVALATTITGLYFIPATALSIAFLEESPSLSDVGGIALAAAAIILIAK